MNPNNSQISNTINGSTINGGNVAIGNQGNINQTNNNYITHQNSTENIAIFGKLSIYLKSKKVYQDLDSYVPFSCVAEIIEDKTGKISNFILFTGYLYPINNRISSSGENIYTFPENNSQYLRMIFSNIIEIFKNEGFYFQSENENSILQIRINDISSSDLRSFTNPGSKCFLHIYEGNISIDKTRYIDINNISIKSDNINMNQHLTKRRIINYNELELDDLIKIHPSIPIIIFTLTVFISCSQFQEISILIIIGMIILLKFLGFIIDLINHVYKASNE